MAATPCTTRKATVVDVHVSFIRPEYPSLVEWMADTERNVYIGRGKVILVPDNRPQDFLDKKRPKRRFPEKDSIFANPFKIPKEVKGLCRDEARMIHQRCEVIKKYEKYIREKIEKGEITVEDLSGLRGKRLGCWCKENGSTEVCHGDILIKILQEKFPEDW